MNAVIPFELTAIMSTKLTELKKEGVKMRIRDFFCLAINTLSKMDNQTLFFMMLLLNKEMNAHMQGNASKRMGADELA